MKLGKGDAEFEKLLGKFIVAAPGAHRVRGDAGLAETAHGSAPEIASELGQ